ncbi:MAG: pH regulation protein F [Deltaproteobacteria bacterium]|nr:MAG: pH regulation protein F [Deltaproteobacteria bacterium]
MGEVFIGAGVFLGGLISAGFYRIIKGPTLFDRIIAVNLVGTMTVVFLLLMGFIYQRVDMFVDISLMYSLLSFIGTLIFAKYLSRGRTE